MLSLCSMILQHIFRDVIRKGLRISKQPFNMSKIHYEDILKPRVDMEREWGILKMDCSVVKSAFNNILMERFAKGMQGEYMGPGGGLVL